MRKLFDSQYLEQELRQVGPRLPREIEAFLIGGGAMALQDLKDATKDIDLVVTRDRDFRTLQHALKELDYEEVRTPEKEYLDLGAQTILENPEGCRFDIFNQQVVNKLILSPGMQSRGTTLWVAGNLVLKTASPEDIFLFKTLAGRTTDIDDMNTLIQTGLNFNAIQREIQTQSNLLGEELFITYINEALIKLEENYGVTTPLQDHVEDVTARVYDKLELLHAIGDGATHAQLVDKTIIPEDRVEELINDLERRGSIKRERGKIWRTEGQI